MSTEWDGDPAEDRDAEFYVERDAADRAAAAFSRGATVAQQTPAVTPPERGNRRSDQGYEHRIVRITDTSDLCHGLSSDLRFFLDLH